ncbi:hypothetical protein U1Q18_032487 [Sarracenia purpurea var. burkii]
MAESARGDPGQGGFGGLFRDETGAWVCGYYGRIENCTPIEAEMWTVHKTIAILGKPKELPKERGAVSPLAFGEERAVLSKPQQPRIQTQ